MSNPVVNGHGDIIAGAEVVVVPCLLSRVLVSSGADHSNLNNSSSSSTTTIARIHSTYRGGAEGVVHIQAGSSLGTATADAPAAAVRRSCHPPNCSCPVFARHLRPSDARSGEDGGEAHFHCGRVCIVRECTINDSPLNACVSGTAATPTCTTSITGLGFVSSHDDICLVRGSTPLLDTIAADACASKAISGRSSSSDSRRISTPDRLHGDDAIAGQATKPQAPVAAASASEDAVVSENHPRHSRNAVVLSIAQRIVCELLQTSSARSVHEDGVGSEVMVCAMGAARTGKSVLLCGHSEYTTDLTRQQQVEQQVQQYEEEEQSFSDRRLNCLDSQSNLFSTVMKLLFSHTSHAAVGNSDSFLCNSNEIDDADEQQHEGHMTTHNVEVAISMLEVEDGVARDWLAGGKSYGLKHRAESNKEDGCDTAHAESFVGVVIDDGTDIVAVSYVRCTSQAEAMRVLAIGYARRRAFRAQEQSGRLRFGAPCSSQGGHVLITALVRAVHVARATRGHSVTPDGRYHNNSAGAAKKRSSLDTCEESVNHADGTCAREVVSVWKLWDLAGPVCPSEKDTGVVADAVSLQQQQQQHCEKAHITSHVKAKARDERAKLRLAAQECAFGSHDDNDDRCDDSVYRAAAAARLHHAVRNRTHDNLVKASAALHCHGVSGRLARLLHPSESNDVTFTQLWSTAMRSASMVVLLAVVCPDAACDAVNASVLRSAQSWSRCGSAHPRSTRAGTRRGDTHTIRSTHSEAATTLDPDRRGSNNNNNTGTASRSSASMPDTNSDGHTTKRSSSSSSSAARLRTRRRRENVMAASRVLKHYAIAFDALMATVGTHSAHAEVAQAAARRAVSCANSHGAYTAVHGAGERPRGWRLHEQDGSDEKSTYALSNSGEPALRCASQNTNGSAHRRDKRSEQDYRCASMRDGACTRRRRSSCTTGGDAATRLRVLHMLRYVQDRLREDADVSSHVSGLLPVDPAASSCAVCSLSRHCRDEGAVPHHRHRAYAVGMDDGNTDRYHCGDNTGSDGACVGCEIQGSHTDGTLSHRNSHTRIDLPESTRQSCEPARQAKVIHPYVESGTSSLSYEDDLASVWQQLTLLMPVLLQRPLRRQLGGGTSDKPGTVRSSPTALDRADAAKQRHEQTGQVGDDVCSLTARARLASLLSQAAFRATEHSSPGGPNHANTHGAVGTKTEGMCDPVSMWCFDVHEDVAVHPRTPSRSAVQAAAHRQPDTSCSRAPCCANQPVHRAHPPPTRVLLSPLLPSSPSASSSLCEAERDRGEGDTPPAMTCALFGT